MLKGLGEDCASASRRLLESGTAPLEIVSQHLIPALDAVGDLFEQNKIFLPQLIRSAEAASFGFDVVRDAIAKSGESQPSSDAVILATVKGDILRFTPELLDVEILFHPFEEQLNLPSVLV